MKQSVSEAERAFNEAIRNLSLSDQVRVMGLADIALTEIIEEKMGWIIPEEKAAVRPIAKKRKKH